MNAEQFPAAWLFPETTDAPSPMTPEPPVDGTERHHECGILRQIVEGTSAPVVIVDEHLRYTYVNPAWTAATGVPASGYLGKKFGSILPDVQTPDDVLIEVLADGKPREVTVTGTTPVPSPVGRRIWRSVFHRLESNGRVIGVCGIGVEVSNLRQYLDDLETAHQRLALLDAAGTRVGTTLDVETTCAELADFLSPSLADVAAVGIVEEEFDRTPPPPPGVLRLRKMKLTAAPEVQLHLRELGGGKPYVDLPRGGFIRNCMDSGRPWRGNSASEELMEKVTAAHDSVKIFRMAGMHSVLVVPLPTAGRSLGTVMLLRGGDSAPFSEDDVLTAQGVAARAATSIDSARRYTGEHAMTLELQRALLSEPTPPHSSIEVATRYLPSGRSVLVGGDWYDSIALPGGRTLLVMGDVMGHGFQAAVAMSQYRSVVRTIATSDSGLTVDEMLRKADHRAARIGLDRVATCLLVLADPEHGTCTAATAGHLPPVIVRPDGSAEVLDLPAGPPIGTELGDYELTTFSWDPDAVLLLYTDGLVEQRGTDIDDAVRGLTELDLPADGPLEHLVDTLLTQLTSGICEDDIALLAARQCGGNPPSAPPASRVLPEG
ncbi:SpoIIE family protein phosphatase [Streptomyces sp. NPDC005921]|uniref:SpoIIE family protein phosphatase n=1 Tax=Streptomyces sp. NPDC005827 TaxID=3157070 RepID=UPI0033F4CACC